MTVELVKHATSEVIDSINRLIPQLSSSAPSLTANQVEALVDQPDIHLFFYRPEEGGPVLGMLTLATFMIPTGLRAWIEDVVVDEAARGKGAGQLLVEAAAKKAAELGCKTIDLTSRPSREAANRLYQRCGFSLRETNVYRLEAK